MRGFVAPNWLIITVSITILETLIGFMVLLGVFTRIAAILGVLNSLNLTLTFSLCKCPWAEADFPLVFWFYSAPFLLNVLVVFDQSANSLGLRGLIKRVYLKRPRSPKAAVT